mmetsp:Transcript_19478/g.32522  ORF Transcript_19478/g.32522 Transcript_19478/m.32522 type:complete len:115 (+) Transcript_19478:747-1091(+)
MSEDVPIEKLGERQHNERVASVDECTDHGMLSIGLVRPTTLDIGRRIGAGYTRKVAGEPLACCCSSRTATAYSPGISMGPNVTVSVATRSVFTRIGVHVPENRPRSKLARFKQT